MTAKNQTVSQMVSQTATNNAAETAAELERLNWINMTSSNIAAVAFDGGNSLFIRFTSGHLYKYIGPEMKIKFTELLMLHYAGESVGKWFHGNLKKHPNFIKIN